MIKDFSYVKNKTIIFSSCYGGSIKDFEFNDAKKIAANTSQDCFFLDDNNDYICINSRGKSNFKINKDTLWCPFGKLGSNVKDLIKVGIEKCNQVGIDSLLVVFNDTLFVYEIDKKLDLLKNENNCYDLWVKKQDLVIEAYKLSNAGVENERVKNNYNVAKFLNERLLKELNSFGDFNYWTSMKYLSEWVLFDAEGLDYDGVKEALKSAGFVINSSNTSNRERFKKDKEGSGDLVVQILQMIEQYNAVHPNLGRMLKNIIPNGAVEAELDAVDLREAIKNQGEGYKRNKKL